MCLEIYTANRILQLSWTYCKVMATKSLILSSKESCSELYYRHFLPWLKGESFYNLLHTHIV